MRRTKDNGFLFARTCGPDMRSEAQEARGFQWPMSGRVKAPDWRRDGQCGRGLHGFLWGWGDPGLASSRPDCKWLVCRAWDHDDLDGKIKVPKAEVLHVGDAASASAYLWDAGVRGVIVPASKTMATFAWSWWTALTEPERARLMLTLSQDVGRMTVSAAAEEARVLMCVDWQVRVSTPEWLDAAKLHAEADALRACRPIVTWADLYAAGPIIEPARRKAAAAWAAAWAAAGAAAVNSLAPTVATLQTSARDLLVRMGGV